MSEAKLFAELRAVAAQVAMEAAGLITSTRTSFTADTCHKANVNDLLTAGDLASEKLIGDRLNQLRPRDGILAEEATISRSDDGTGVTWVVDPIDGTINYATGRPEIMELGPFGVSIGAMLDDTRVVAGAIALPTYGRLYSAASGLGATCNNQALHIDNSRPLKESVGLFERSANLQVRKMQSRLFADLIPDVRDLRSHGCCSADFCQVAAGTAQFMLQHGGGPWDVAAGSVIVREAGGKVGGLDDGIPRGSFALAAASNIFDELRERIRMLSSTTDSYTHEAAVSTVR